MRMSQSGTSAADLVNNLSQKELSKIIYTYGEEKYADSISKAIVKYREEKPIETTFELADIIRNSVPERVRRAGHPARKTFQALRIEVNHELDALEKGLDEAFELLCTGGRLAVITFHSLEDRIVKQKMASWYQGCTCPKDFPVCVCGNKPKAKPVTRKPIVANSQELSTNPRSRSAKLRICEKILEKS
jgi:16S rRNA (cytosine1402-N4)-methyltransferase